MFPCVLQAKFSAALNFFPGRDLPEKSRFPLSSSQESFTHGPTGQKPGAARASGDPHESAKGGAFLGARPAMIKRRLQKSYSFFGPAAEAALNAPLPNR